SVSDVRTATSASQSCTNWRDDIMRRQSLWKGIAAGAVAGLAGAIAMTQFQNLWSKISEKVNTNAVEKPAESSGQESEDATMKAAGKVAEAAGYTLSHEQKKRAGPLVHYG